MPLPISLCWLELCSGAQVLVNHGDCVGDDLGNPRCRSSSVARAGCWMYANW